MPSRLPMPPEIIEVYFDFDWDRRKVWALDIETEIIDRELLEWHLDLPFWSSRPPEPLFDLVPRRVIEDASVHPVHARRIEQADMNVPLDVMEHRGRLCIMDGFHRLAKAVLEERQQAVVRKIPREMIPRICHGPSPPLVYLDQSVWSSWARGSYSTEASERLTDLAADGRFLMVVSQWHVVETVKLAGSTLTTEEERRKLDHARFMERLPNLVGLRPTRELLVQEVARAYATRLGTPLVMDPPAVVPVTGITQLIEAALAADAGYVPRARGEVRFEPGGRGSMGWWSWLDNLGHRPNQAAHRAARYDRAWAKKPRTWATSLRERLTIKPLVRGFEGIAGALRERAFALGLVVYRSNATEYLGFEPHFIDLLRWLWRLDFQGAPALVYRVEYQRLLDPSGERQPDANDGRDVEHGFAAPFVDILVHESGHVEIARRAAKKAGLACKIFNGRPKTREFEQMVEEVERRSE